MITVSHLTKMYGLRTAVNDLSFEVKKGEVVGFLGPNGAGKSTTMKILTGFMPATLGKVTVAGFDVFDQTVEVKRNVGYLPETPPVYNEMTVLDYLDHAARLHQVPSAKRRASVGLAIDKTSLGHVAGRLIGNLSKGYKQRVGLAQTLVHNPAVLILDEPTVGLDPKQIIEIRELIKGLAGEHTVILSTHILPEVAATCQRVIVINKGRIVAQDTLEQLSNRLKRGQVFTLQVRQTEPSAIAALKSLPGVTSVSTEGSKILLEVAPEAGEVRDRIVETAVQARMGVLEFAAEKLSLEDVFVQLTTEEAK
jgi:ABC-2 type transport system ATP-binding protein